MLFLVDMLISKLSSLSWNVTEVSEMSTHHIEFELFLRLKLHCKHNKTLRIFFGMYYPMVHFTTQIIG